MTHPAVITMLMAARHAELLREAEGYRRAAAARTGASRALPNGLATLATLAALVGRLSAPAATRRASSQLCCA